MASSATAVPSLSVMSSDSPVSSSPNRSNSINVKRAAVTYSRKRHAIEEEGLSSAPAARDWDEVHTRTLLSVNDEPLSSSNSSRLSDETSANEDIGRDEAPGFVFAWKKKLAEWSDQEEPGSSTPNANKQLSANLSRPRPIDTPETRCAATTYSLGSDISPEHLFAIDDGHRGVSVTEVMSSPPPSAGMGPSRRRAFHRDVVRDSGSESELSNAKLESSFHKSSPFAFQTPNSRSSPTPPTSDDETSPWPTLPKGKGKMGTVSRRSVSPLRFGGESLSAMGSGNLEGTSGNRRTKVRKVKAPTKKEKLETAKGSLRLAADQHIFIPKAESDCKYTLHNFLEYLTDNQTRGVKQASDPIVSFSSSPPGPRVGSTTDSAFLLRQDAVISKTIRADDISCNAPAIQQGSVETAKWKDLQTKKRRLLAVQQVRAETDDEDDLEIIADDESAPSDINQPRLTSRGKRLPSFSASKHERLGIGPATHLQAEHRSNKAGISGKAALTQIGLSRMLAQKVSEHNKQLTARKDEEWIKSGGQLKGVLTEEDGRDTLRTYVQKGLENAAKNSKRQVELDDRSIEANDSSESSNSDNESETAHRPVLADVQSDQEEAEEPRIKIRHHRKVAILDSDSEIEKDEPTLPSEDFVFQLGRSSDQMPLMDESDEKHDATLPVENALYKFGRSNLGRMPSIDESDENSMPPPTLSRGSVSSLDEHAEDRSDKENNRTLMFDRGEDKENKATVRHTVCSSPKVLPDAQNGANLSSSGLHANSRELEDENALRDDKRSPLTVLSEDGSSKLQFDSSRADILTAQSHRSASPNAQAVKVIQREDVPSASSAVKFDATLLPEASFSALFESGTDDPKSLRNSANTTTEGPPDSLQLTQDLTLQPAFNINDQALLRKAESIFEKEQAYLLEAGNKGPQKKQLYVNDFGFLTQTRPHNESPELYKTPYVAHTEVTAEIPTSSPTKGYQRYPLSTLSLLTPEGSDEPIDVPKKRLVKWRTPSPSHSLLRTDLGSPTPVPRLVMKVSDMVSQRVKGVAQPEKRRNKLEKSEFVQSEAEESDDDDVFNFLPKKKDEEEEDNNDLDRTLETLVDDGHMDEETLNARGVLEKFKEDMELDDQELEKLHQAAAQGELRRKRRHRGIGLDDSDDESDEDERARKIRRKMNKSQRIDRDNIKALANNEETAAFYREYEHGVLDDDGIEVHHDVVMGDVGNDDSQGTEDYVTRDEIQDRARELAKRKEIEPSLDPHDVSWIDKGTDEEIDLSVRVTKATRKKNVALRRGGFDKDFDDIPEISKPLTVLEDDRDKSRMRSWARIEGKSRNTTTARSGCGVAVTGHAKSKTRIQGNAEEARSTAEQHSRRKPLKATPSMLADVSDRSSRFR